MLRGMTPLLLLLATIPSCASASHDRLVVQPGRDVCAAPLNSRGEPRAPGFLPTSCPRAGQDYRVDARGQTDLCLEPRKANP